MSRVEKNAGIEKRLEGMRGEMVGEVKRRTRRSRPWLTCSLLVLGLLVAICLWAAWMVAASGLVRVPVFTAVAYEVPQPTREVTPGVPVETVLDETFSSTLTRRLYEGGGVLQDRSIQLVLAEGSFTASVRSFLEESDLDWIETSRVQMVVDPEVGVELFVPFSSQANALGSAATIQLDLSAGEEGELVVTPTEVLVGQARVPEVIVNVFLMPFLKTELAKLNASMVGYAKLSTIEVLPRELIVTGELSVEIEPL